MSNLTELITKGNIPALTAIFSFLCFLLGVLGTTPFPNQSNELDAGQRITLIVVAVFLGTLAFWGWLRSDSEGRYQVKPRPLEPNPQFEEKLEEAQKKFAEIVPAGDILRQVRIGNVTVSILNRNIQEAKTDAIVSSDDNHISAEGGVAKAILNKAGEAVKNELVFHRGEKHTSLRQGDIVVTTGGNTGARYIYHPVVIDRDEDLYPSIETISTIVKRLLTCATTHRVESIALPVLGGGTGGTEDLTAWESIRTIIKEVLGYIATDDKHFRTIQLYIYDKKDVQGDLKALIKDECDALDLDCVPLI